MPWGAYDPTGHLRIGGYDRSDDTANHSYFYSLWTETAPGSLSFNKTHLSTVASNPTTGSRWYTDPANNPNFPNANSFLGDYSGIAVTPTGRVVALWTDMRGQVCVQGVCGSQEDAFFGSSS